jgi:hypothetical protein
MKNFRNIWRKGLQGPVSLTAASGTGGVPLVKPHSAPHHSVALLKKGEGGREKEDRKEERGEVDVGCGCGLAFNSHVCDAMNPPLEELSYCCSLRASSLLEFLSWNDCALGPKWPEVA